MGKPKEKVIVESTGVPAWMLTLGDCMSLLLTFFVMLITFSSRNDDQLMAIIGVMQGALGAVKMEGVAYRKHMACDDRRDSEAELIERGDLTSHNTRADALSPVILDRVELINRFTEEKQRLTSLGFSHVLSIDELEEGLRIRFSVGALFDERGGLRPEAGEILNGTATLAANVANEVRIVDVMGEATSPAPAGLSPWAATIRRSTLLGDEMINRYGLESSRLGYGMRLAETGEEAGVEFVIMDDFSTREISFQDLWTELARGGEKAAP